MSELGHWWWAFEGYTWLLILVSLILYLLVSCDVCPTRPSLSWWTKILWNHNPIYIHTNTHKYIFLKLLLLQKQAKHKSNQTHPNPALFLIAARATRMNYHKNLNPSPLTSVTSRSDEESLKAWAVKGRSTLWTRPPGGLCSWCSPFTLIYIVN